MFPLPQKESRASATCPGPDSTQELSRNNGGGLEEGCSRNPDQKGLKLYQVGDPTATFSCDSSCLSSRGKIVKWFWDSAEKGYRTYHENEYDEDKNPSGIINLGTSENKLCFDLLSWRLRQSDMLQVEPSLLQYGDWRGHLFLREEVAKFLSFYCKSPAPLKPENVVVLNGCASLFSALATVLCEVGEAFLIPTPYYGAITQHVFLYGSVRLVYVHLDSEVTGQDTRPFQLTVEKLEMALRGANSEGVKVKGLILINPQNPLGDIYSPGELQEYLEFAKRWGTPEGSASFLRCFKSPTVISVVSVTTGMVTLGQTNVPLPLPKECLGIVVQRHETQACSGPEPDSLSISSLVHPKAQGFHAAFSPPCAPRRLPDPQRTHVMWATSKDFGMSGLRFGTLYTENQDVATAVASLCRYHGLSGLLQSQMAQMLRDRDWINQVYLPENHARLKAAHAYVSEELRALGVPFLSRGAGFFIWVDLRKFLPKGTFEEEMQLWYRFLENKVLLSYGKAFQCREPGWFRIIFSDRAHRLRLGMQRVRQVLEGKSQVVEEPASLADPGAK
ncbi:1-aminocyclopropane-1-carboxylate synthase-like protein 1 [Tupaia chinensis]|uniref:1-aminocyclopropane-1-carboxylate synthase-like protein 1 n=1 Tax=Tupaia chinensis TaxID=246437 RepID=UPI000FFB533F|nr:1-aminocyclopropane-1-carboxylate synthase-like protein 1 [Tupaia chinensis]